MTIRAISYGGGVQSTALLVLACTERLDVDVALFANVGDDSEHPATLDYLHNIAIPYAAAHDFPLHELRRGTRTLYRDLVSDMRSIDIPVFMAGGAPGNRKCTERFKIAVVRRWLRDNGATKTDPAELVIGFSWDEVRRMKDIADPIATRSYPLIDRRLNRGDCGQIIRDAGLPVPPKSSCWFCPYRGTKGFAVMRRDEPDLFDRAVALEDRINEKRVTLGRDPVRLTGSGQSLALLPAAQDALFDVDADPTCDAWTCFT